MMVQFTYDEDDDLPPETPIQRAEKRQWQYATHDPVACAALAEAMGRSCRLGRTITYADLARGVTFRLPGVNDGMPYVIDILDRKRVSKFDQNILDDFLAFLSLQSMKGASILASANVFDPHDSRGASNGFFETARWLGVLPELRGEMNQMLFWKHELRKVHDWFAKLAATTN